MTIPRARTWLDNDPLNTTNLNNDSAAVLFAQDPPAAIAIRSGAAQSIPNSTFTTITLDTEVADQGGLWTSGAPTLLTFPEDGLYIAGGELLFASNATGYREVDLELNAAAFSLVADAKAAISGAATPVHASGLFLVAASNTLRMRVFQTSGGALNTWATDRFPRLWAARVSGA